MSDTPWKFPSSEAGSKQLLLDWSTQLRSRKLGDYGEGIQEIRFGAIILDARISGLYTIEANTVHGLRRFVRAQEVIVGDPQSEGCIDVDCVYIFEPVDWTVIDLSSVREPQTKQPKQPLPHTNVERQGRTAQDILAKLEDEGASPETTREMILEAEVTPFDRDQTARLNTALRRFIQSRRTSEAPNDLIVVASAIRKYVTTMGCDELGSLSVLLDARHNTTVPLEVELEVAKTLVRKLSSHPPDKSDPEPELADRLWEIAETYLKERLLSREKYGAIALNAILALALLRSRNVSDLAPVLKNLRPHWFTELVLRRAERIQTDLMQRFPGAQAERYVACLRAVCNELT